MKMELLKVNRNLCSKCGLCVAICPKAVLEMDGGGPKTLFAEGCIACGHCVAVCPQAALDHEKAPLAKQIPLDEYPVISPETAVKFLRARRSIRNYRQDKVTLEKILQLLEIARFAPTGSNSQGLSYLVIEDETILRKITAFTIDWLEERTKSDAAWEGYAGIVDIYRNTGMDVVLRGAPCLILAIAPREFRIGRDNARYSLEYVELYATTLGLGTCWAGFVELAAGSGFTPLLEAARIPEGMAIAGVMMVGYPQYAYQRLVDRNPLDVRWLS
jgi:nitroreductase/NAD-dependent dihydropyrimidine dehydrogenase PreA subunit